LKLRLIIDISKIKDEKQLDLFDFETQFEICDKKSSLQNPTKDKKNAKGIKTLT